MRLFTTILLATIFLFTSVGYQLIFSLLILYQQEEMGNLLAESENSSLAVIVIDVSNHRDFSQINEKEFFYKGSLYDIKSKEINGDKTIYHCKKDEKELDLLNHLCQMNDENKSNSSKNPLNRFLQKSPQKLFFANQQFANSLIPQKELFYEVVSIHYKKPDSYKLTPPPQFYYS